MGQRAIVTNIRINCSLTPVFLNHQYASIYFNVELEALSMPAWTWHEIQAGMKLGQEWGVDKELIPCYGD